MVDALVLCCMSVLLCLLLPATLLVVERNVCYVDAFACTLR